MSQDYVAVVVKQFMDTNARVFSDVMDAYADDVSLVMHDKGVLSSTAEGRDAVGEWFADFLRQFGRDFQFEVEETRDFGDRVFLVARSHGRGRASGVHVEQRWSYLYSVRDGRIIGVEIWRDREAAEAALVAAGLSE